MLNVKTGYCLRWGTEFILLKIIQTHPPVFGSLSLYPPLISLYSVSLQQHKKTITMMTVKEYYHYDC